MTAALYATAVEEYRIRHLLNGMVLAAHQQGGCVYATPQLLARQPDGCDYIETSLEAYYTAAVGRYTADVLTLHQITATMNFANFSKDAQALLTKIGSCSSTFSGECAFSYGKLLIEQRTDTEAVYMDANGVLKPSPSNQTALASSVSTVTSPPLNLNLFAPARVEVYACATVPSLIPRFLFWQFPPFKAVARGAATPVMVEEDWLQPGAIVNAYTSALYQPVEKYLIGGAKVTDLTGYDWYNLDYGGNGVVAVAGAHFSSKLLVDEFSVYVGWWNSIPIHPFSGLKSTVAMGCTT
jgi:hypothetical protein